MQNPYVPSDNLINAYNNFQGQPFFDIVNEIIISDCGHTGRSTAILNSLSNINITFPNTLGKKPYNIGHRITHPNADLRYQRAVPDIDCPILLVHCDTGRKIKVTDEYFTPETKVDFLIHLIEVWENVIPNKINLTIGTLKLSRGTFLRDYNIRYGTVIIYSTFN
jgi:hypothetical protein